MVVGAPALENSAAGTAAAVLEPITAIGHPPGDERDGQGGAHRPPDGQEEICQQTQDDENQPEDLALHAVILMRDRRGGGRKLSFPAHGCYTRAMKRALKEVAEYLGAVLIGDGRAEVSGVASLQSAKAGDMVFVEDPKHLTQAQESRATAIIAGEFARTGTRSKPVLIAAQPRLAFARTAAWLGGRAASKPRSHATAVVHASAKLAKGACVEERAVIREHVVIGENTQVGAGCVIEQGVKIGRNGRLHPNVTIYPGVTLGDRVVIHAGVVLGSDGFGYVQDEKTGRYEKFPQIGRLEIEDDVEIGANSTVDRGALDVTRIRRGTKIDNLVHVGHNVDIGEDVVIAAQTGLSGSSVVENGVIIGGQVGIADHVRIEAGAILGAQSGIPSKKVIRGKGVVFWGTPARPIKTYLKELAALARLAKKETPEP
jgi:UDP-3-O-[3-hydroxymyristoyl] glucosamine N-acyltransferase